MSRGLQLAAIGALVFAYAFLVQPAGEHEKAHYALARAVADGQPYVDEYVRGPEWRTVDTTRIDGHLYAAKAPGLALFSVPYVAVLDAVGVDARPERALWLLHLWVAVLPALVLLLLVRAVADRFEPGLGIAAAVVLGAATLVLPFATLSFSHVLSATLGFAAFALLLGEHRARPRVVRSVCAGLLAGSAITVEYSLAIVALALAIYLASGADRLRQLSAYCAGLVLGVAPGLAFDWWAFRSLSNLAYERWSDPDAPSDSFAGQFDDVFPDLHVLLQLLLSPAGVASVVAGAVGAALMYRTRARPEALVVLGVAAAYLLYNSLLSNPFGGASPGPRYLIPALPFLCVFIPLALRRFAGAAVGLAVPTAVFLTAATITSPLAAWDGEVTHRLRTGGYVRSVLDFVGIGGGAVDLIFVGVVVVAAAIGLAAVRPLWRRVDTVALAIALPGWAIVASQSRRLVSAGLALELAFAAVAAALAAALVWLYRREPVLY